MIRATPTSGDLTHSQRQIWIGQRLHRESPLYNMAFSLRFPRRLREDLFREAWRRVAGSSDALRTHLVESGDGKISRIVAPRGPDIEFVDLANAPDPEATYRQWCRDRCARPLPLDGPLVDSVLVGLGERTAWYLNQHHLVTDAWSLQLLCRRVAAEYEALESGDEPEDLERLPSYYEAAAALEPDIASRERARGFWESHGARSGRSVALYGCPPHPRDTASVRSTLELDEERSRSLEELARQPGFRSLFEDMSRFNLFATLLASWLSRVTGRRQVGFDTPVTGRPTAEAKKTLGLFIELFPFAVTVEPQDTFRTLATRSLEETVSLLRHALPGTSSPSAATAGNVVLNYFPASIQTFAGLPVEAEWIHPGHGDSVHALRLQIHDFDGSGRYRLHFDANEGIFPSSILRRMPQHFERMLDACIEDPDRQIASVDLLLDDERETLASLDATASRSLPARTVVDRFFERAEADPNAIALRQGGAEVTFEELRSRVDALASTLLGRGLEREDRVAVSSRRSIEAVVAILATMRAGGAWVPVEPSAPEARLQHVFRDSGARFLLATGEVAAGLTGHSAELIPIGEGLEAGSGQSPETPLPGLDDLAYVIYTSGSTGAPKGVLVEHGGLADYVEWAEREYVRGDRLTFPLFTSLAFDLTVTSLFLPLVTGGTLEVYPEPGGAVDSALMDVLAADAVDLIKLTPSHLSLLVRLGLEGSRIRRMVVGGENLATALAAAASAQLHDRVEIYNEYGPTEAVVGCVAHRYDPLQDAGPSVPIGLPVDHVSVEIVNDGGEPVPVGAPGELRVSRYGLARGYQGLDDVTRDRFRPSRRDPDRRVYRTGDLVRVNVDGVLEFLGRLDRQIKVSGFRVEPAEIESAMSSIPGVEQCAVISRQRPSATLAPQAEIRHCVRCGLPSNYPRATFDESGVCSVCTSYDAIKEHAEAYFGTVEDLQEIFAESAPTNSSEYDCLMLFSGGKDSSYALCRLVEMGLSVYAFTLDNGFISDSAKENIRRIAELLGVPVEFATTPAMNDIFRDSLVRFSNVCNGCFKTIYTLSMHRAHDLGIPIIVTGLSRGQMFETRLTEEMFRDGRRTPDEVDAAVLAARKVYHRVSDEVSRSLDVRIFENDTIFDEIRFVDFYRYIDVGLDEIYEYLKERVPWVRPADTGRSTNCLINDVGIWVHNRERGFHNYALPYSWDVRMGHKDRDAALAELDDDIDVDYVRETLETLGYDEDRGTAAVDQTALYGFYVPSGPVGAEDLRNGLAERLPPQLIPMHLQAVDSIPLTANGKVDEDALSRMALAHVSDTPYRPPEGPVAEFLADLWQRELGVEQIGADDGFFELGGTSLSAMEVMIRVCREFDVDLPLETLFTHPTLAGLARVTEDRILADVSGLEESEHRDPTDGTSRTL